MGIGWQRGLMLRLELSEQCANFRRQLFGSARRLRDGAAVRPFPLPVKARLETLQEGGQLSKREEGRGGGAEPGDPRLLPHCQPRVATPRHRDSQNARRPPGEAVDFGPNYVADAHGPTIGKQAFGDRLGENGGR